MYYLLKTDAGTTERVHITDVQMRIASGQLESTSLLAPEKAPNNFRTVSQTFPTLFMSKPVRELIEMEARTSEGKTLARNSITFALLAPVLWIPAGLVPFFMLIAPYSIPVLATFAIVYGIKAVKVSSSTLGLFGATIGFIEIASIIYFLFFMRF